MFRLSWVDCGCPKIFPPLACTSPALQPLSRFSSAPKSNFSFARLVDGLMASKRQDERHNRFTLLSCQSKLRIVRYQHAIAPKSTKLDWCFLAKSWSG